MIHYQNPKQACIFVDLDEFARDKKRMMLHIYIILIQQYTANLEEEAGIEAAMAINRAMSGDIKNN